MQITLRPITARNWRRAAHLKLTRAQQAWVAPNWYSIIETLFEGGTMRAIYAGRKMVGFVLYEKAADDQRWWIVRFMIDHAQQGKGYGRAALTAIIAAMRQNPDCRDIYTSVVVGNEVASRLYLSVGFLDTGQIKDGEIVYRLPA